MALITIAIDNCVIIVGMARGTLHGEMGSRQREICRAVVERGIIPARCRMALTAIMTEVTRNVVRVGCLLVLRGVTLVTCRVNNSVVIVHMARLALE